MYDKGASFGDIRTVVDPLLMKLREELMGSGVSFGRIIPGVLPPSTVVVGGPGGTTDPDTLDFLKNVKVYSGGTLIGTAKELSFIGPSVTIAADRATIDISPALAPKITNPMTAAGDIIYALSGGTPARKPIGINGQYLAVVAGSPEWVSLASGTGGALADPTTTVGDMLYRNAGGVTRLPIGTSGYVLLVSGGEPIWAPAPLTGMQNPMTTFGDMIRATTGGAPERLPIGASGYILMVSGGTANWVQRPIDYTDPLTAAGDILYRNVSNIGTRLPIGTTGQVLTVSGGLPVWAEVTISGGGGGGYSDPVRTGTSAIVIPGLLGSADVFNRNGATVSYEFDTGTLFTWSSAVATEDISSTIPSHYYMNHGTNTDHFGYYSFSPAGAFDARIKLSFGSLTFLGVPSVYLYIGDSTNANRFICGATCANNKQLTFRTYKYESGGYTLQQATGEVGTHSTIYLRITFNSPWYDGYFSFDGLTWHRITSGTSFTSFTVARLGILLADDPAEIAIDWLRVV